MGKITFWGIQHGLGVTSLAAAVAAFMGTGYSIRTLVSQPQWSDFTLEKSFGRSISSYNGFFADVASRGIDALERAARSNKLERDTIKNHALPIIRGQLDLLQATENEDKLHFENSSEIINIIFDKAEEYYDSILLDAHSGSQHAVTNQLLQSSDLVVVCLSQDRNVLDKYFDPSRRYWPEALHHVPHMLVIGRYDAHSKYKVRNIAGKYNYKGDIFPFSYNTGFRDSMNDGNLRGYFLENHSVHKQHENYRFIQDIREIAAHISEKIEVFVPIQQAERRVP